MPESVAIQTIPDLEAAMNTWPLTTTSVVWDIGAYAGMVVASLQAGYGCSISAFEPQVPIAEELQRRFPRVKVLPFGLGIETGEFPMVQVGTDGASFVFEEGAHRQRGTGHLVEIGDQMRQMGIDNIDLMVMNIEGCEYALVPHMIRHDLIEKVRFLQMGTHPRGKLYGKMEIPTIEDILVGMRNTHFIYWNYALQWICWARHGEESYSGQGTRYMEVLKS